MTGLPPVGDRTLRGAYDRALAEMPDATAQIGPGGRYTFAQSHERSLRVAGGLTALGVARQDPVALLMDNSLDAVHAWTGTSLGGMVEVPVNSAYKGSFLTHVLNDSGAAVLVCDDTYAERIAAVAGDLTALRTLVVRGDTAAADDLRDRFRVVGLDEVTTAEPAAPQAIDAADLMAYMYTSGTTGPSKGVLIPHAHAYTYASREDQARPVAGDRILVTLPLFHGNALFAAFAPSAYVGCTFAMRRKFSASGFLPDVLRYNASYFNYVGRSLSYILAQPEVPEEKQTRLRVVFGTEASVHDRTEFERRFGVTPLESYGSSEGGVVISHTEDTPPGALGVAGAYMDVAILDADENECPRAEFDANGGLVNAGEAIGEICNVTGAKLFEGYYRNPEATAERNVGEVFHTGDLGYRDADGYFYFAGRSGDRIRVDSENFSAGPVERILDRFPGVLVVAVYPVPDPRTGDQVMAAIQLEPGVEFDADAFSEFCRTQPDMGTKWAPRFVRVMTEMPVTATRKISKPSLRRESWIEPGEVYLRGGAAGDDDVYRPLTDADREALLTEYELHGRRPVGV